MTPTSYMAEIVIPTAQEFMAARGDRRRAYLACIAAFHLCDYVQRADGKAINSVRRPIRALCEPSFDVVEGICNGSKHCGRDGRGAFDHQPGTEREIPIFAFDVSGAGWGQGRFSVPGLGVEHHGQELCVDWCLQAFLLSAAKAFPDHFRENDWSWIDAAFKASAPRLPDA